MNKAYAEYLLVKTREDYNLISDDYARTRHFTWDIEGFNKYVNTGEKILDLGCGNGRLLEIIKDKNIEYIGLDSSKKLIEIAQKQHPNAKFLVGETLNLPFAAESFDKVFSIRLLHHIPSKMFRAQFFNEIKKVLKPGGLLILTVWNVYGLKSKKNFLMMGKNFFLKLIGKSKLDFGDALIPWSRKAMRYYHFFTKKELEKIAQEVNLKIKKIWVTPFDIYLIAEK